MGLDIRNLFVLFSVMVSVWGCGSTSKRVPDQALIEQIQTLEKKNQALKEQILLKKSAQAPAKAVSKEPQEPEVKFNDEHSLYQAGLEAYWKKDSAQLRRVTTIFLKTFPKSPFADNLLYLKGSLDFSRDDIRSSLESLNRLVEEYPLSNKRVSADLLRAILLKRLNLHEQSQDILRRIVRQYPGSVEANQAKLELRDRKSVERK